MLNEVLTPVIIDRSTEHPYPIIRFAEPPTLQTTTDTVGTVEHDLRESVRRMAVEHRKATIELGRQTEPNRGRELTNQEGRQAPPGGWLNYWRNTSEAEQQAYASRWDL